MNRELLRVENLSVAYGDTQVVKGIDFSLRAGETLALVGESGSGKSQTAHALLRLLPGAARLGGSVRLDGEELLALSPQNSFLDEISRQYVATARAKGLGERRVLYGHVFRNAMLLVVAGLPAALVSVFFTGSLLIEVLFSLDGLGLMGYEAALGRDYPVVFGSLFIFTLLGLLVKLAGDLAYSLVDPRIDFAARKQ